VGVSRGTSGEMVRDIETTVRLCSGKRGSGTSKAEVEDQLLVAMNIGAESIDISLHRRLEMKPPLEEFIRKWKMH